MARLTIEDCWWHDPRRAALGRLVGGEELADAIAIRAWRLAQDYWKRDREPIPRKIFDLVPFSHHLLDVGLAIDKGKGIYICGSAAYLDWLNLCRAAGKRGGLKRLENSRKKAVETKRKNNDAPTHLEGFQPSSSSSFSSSKNKNESVPLSERSLTLPPPRNLGDGQRLIGEYVTAFQKKYGANTRPEITGKTAGQVKSLLKTVPLDRAIQLVQVYLQMDDRWFETKHHDFSTFIENLNKVGVALDTGKNPGAIEWDKVFAAANDTK